MDPPKPPEHEPEDLWRQSGEELVGLGPDPGSHGEPAGEEDMEIAL